jgi:hypothetical protein
MTADEILDVLDKLHALRHVRAITPEEFALRKAYLLTQLDGAIGLDAVAAVTAGVTDAAGDAGTDASIADADGERTADAAAATGGVRRAPGISPNVAVAMLLVVTAIVGVIAFTLGRSVPEPGTGAENTAVVVRAPAADADR